MMCCALIHISLVGWPMAQGFLMTHSFGENFLPSTLGLTLFCRIASVARIRELLVEPL